MQPYYHTWEYESRSLERKTGIAHALFFFLNPRVFFSCARISSARGSSIWYASSGGFRDRKSPSCTTYGPKRPMFATISLPVSGCVPSTRGRERNLSASSRVSFEISTFLGTLARRSLGAPFFFVPFSALPTWT